MQKNFRIRVKNALKIIFDVIIRVINGQSTRWYDNYKVSLQGFIIEKIHHNMDIMIWLKNQRIH